MKEIQEDRATVGVGTGRHLRCAGFYSDRLTTLLALVLPFEPPPCRLFLSLLPAMRLPLRCGASPQHSPSLPHPRRGDAPGRPPLRHRHLPTAAVFSSKPRPRALRSASLFRLRSRGAEPLLCLPYPRRALRQVQRPPQAPRLLHPFAQRFCHWSSPWLSRGKPKFPSYAPKEPSVLLNTSSAEPQVVRKARGCSLSQGYRP